MKQHAGQQVRAKPRRKAPGRWKKGQSGNPKGRPKGSKHKVTEEKIEIIARTGMMPLDFLTAVYRDELYDRYITEMLPDGRTQVFKPDPKALRIRCKLPQRIQAATSAAAYVHKKMPVGIEVSDKNQRLATAQRLALLSQQQLDALVQVLDQIAPLEEEPQGRLLEHQPDPA